MNTPSITLTQQVETAIKEAQRSVALEVAEAIIKDVYSSGGMAQVEGMILSLCKVYGPPFVSHHSGGSKS